jgi:RNA ligase
MFKRIESIADIKPAVAHKNEIRFYKQPNGITMSLYLFMDSKTFDSPEARECRGAAFDDNGDIVSRPLHKFFNMGEKDYLSPEKLLERTDIVGIYEKLDGSMIATAWVNGALAWRSKKSFDSDVVKLVHKFLAEETGEDVFMGYRVRKDYVDFAETVAAQGHTAIFELTHPEAQIVVPQSEPRLRLLHVRENITGEYVMLDPDHYIHTVIDYYRIPVVPKLKMPLQQAFDNLEIMHNQEGYVVQFADGDMVKIKCPWYTRLHRSITFLRERDIAVLALNEELDDMKRHMVEVGIPLAKVEEVESRLKSRLLELTDEIEAAYEADKNLDKKSFAIKNSKHPLFGLMMGLYTGAGFNLNDWYSKNRLKAEFSLKSLLEGAQAEAAEG